MDMGLTSMNLEKAQFEISQLVYQSVGVNLHTGKQELVKARLAKRLRMLGLKTLDPYMSYLKYDNPKEELSEISSGKVMIKSNGGSGFFNVRPYWKIHRSQPWH